MIQDTSLCAIVRDEKMNPAGGIARFIDSVVPFVEQAVIVDTGSVDGTREILEEMQKKYPNICVFDRPFDNYADSRNFSLEQVKTPKALILDADELILSKDFEILAEFMGRCPSRGYRFGFNCVEMDGKITRSISQHNPRLFEIFGVSYFNIDMWEHLKRQGKEFCAGKDTVRSPIPIYHFMPEKSSLDIKYGWWTMRPSIWQTRPSQVAGFEEWKRFNPNRDKFGATSC